MGSTEYIVMLCFVITIWSNSVNADIDCRRFVFAPACRGVSAKRSQMRDHNEGRMADFLGENPIIASEGLEDETQLQRRYQKRFTDLIKSSLLRRVRSKDLRRFNSLLNSMEEMFGSNDLED